MKEDREIIFSITRKRKPRYEWYSPRRKKLDLDYKWLAVSFYFLLVFSAASISAGWQAGYSLLTFGSIALSFYFATMFLAFVMRRENNYLADRFDRLERKKRI